jgi:hypothetical protein
MAESKNVNDQRILDLRVKLKENGKNLKPVNFRPETHCKFNFNGSDLNLHIISTERLIELQVYLTSQKQACERLKLTDIVIQGFKLDSWLEDVSSKLQFNIYKEELKKHQEIEKKLDVLLSEETKTQLELDQIENLLK